MPAVSLRACSSSSLYLRFAAYRLSYQAAADHFRGSLRQQQSCYSTAVESSASDIRDGGRAYYSNQPGATSHEQQQPPPQEPPSSTADSKSVDTRTELPFYFKAGYGLHAKRGSRPFPPPFLSLPTSSFSDPLSTHNQSRDRRKLPTVNGELLRGITNGDDAVLVSDSFVCANDGVGAWATREKGHAPLWSRLIVHFWAVEVEKYTQRLIENNHFEEIAEDKSKEPNPVAFLSSAFEDTKKATAEPNEWYGTTTASGALLSFDKSKEDQSMRPVLYVTQLGDSMIMVVRPRDRDVIYKTSEQWHWFDCPRQLGTNSPDTPENNAVMERVEIEAGDVVLAMSDGVIDNLWDHEIMQNVVDSIQKWDNKEARPEARSVSDDAHETERQWYSEKMMFVAEELMKSARVIAEDPFAESPYMEKAIDEGLSIEGGKRDDISVVAAQCVARGKG